jgi:hypothetical protein
LLIYKNPRQSLFGKKAAKESQLQLQLVGK